MNLELLQCLELFEFPVAGRNVDHTIFPPICLPAPDQVFTGKATVYGKDECKQEIGCLSNEYHPVVLMFHKSC